MHTPCAEMSTNCSSASFQKVSKQSFHLDKKRNFEVMIWPNLCIIDPIRPVHPPRYTRDNTIGRVFSFFWNVWKLNGNCYFIFSPNKNAFSAYKVH